jgi:phenylalanyl-tRNA synthetase beta chain
MLIPLGWLKEHVDVAVSAEDLAHQLTMAGLEVEEIREEEGEVVLNITITPNRGDCLSVVGVARDVAALTGASLRPPEEGVAASGPAEPQVSVTIEAPVLCPRYAARIVRGVLIGPSPEWLQRRLALAGLRPINNVVDVTNYVMLEQGQPLHAFDYATLRGGRIVVRTPRPGERIVIIDGTEVALEPEMLVIADADRPVAIAGVMGGAETEVTEGTTDLLLESAHFDPVSVRRTSKRIPLSTAASYRFERIVDPAGVVRALDRAAALIAELAGGAVSETLVDNVARPISPRRISFDVERGMALLGMDVPRDEARQCLERLGLHVTVRDAGRWEVEVPSYRPDLTIEPDLIEEIGRLVGYAHLPETAPVSAISPGGRSPLGRLSERLRDQLLGYGLNEAATHTLLSRAFLDRTRLQRSPAWPGEGGSVIALRNPLSEELNALRPSLLPGLLTSAAYNRRHGQEDLFLFEVGYVHSTVAGKGTQDRLLVAGLLHGTRWAGAWNVKRAETLVDFYTAKGVVDGLLTGLGIVPDAFERTDHPALHPGRAAALQVGGKILGAVGELHPEVAEAMDLPRELYLFELDAQRLLKLQPEARHYTAPSRFPAAARDLAVVVPAAVPAETIRAAIVAGAPDRIREVRLFDVYRGRPLPEDRVSLAFALQLGAPDRTLTDAEADAILEAARRRLAQEFGAEFRG